MGRVLVLAPCCGGKSSLHALLRGELPSVESDEAVLEAAGGTWPETPEQNRRLVVRTATEALERADVVLFTSFVPDALLASTRAGGTVAAVIDVPRAELERRNRQRVEAGDNDMAHWFDEQLPRFERWDAAGLIDHHLDGGQALDELADHIRRLAGRPRRR